MKYHIYLYFFLLLFGFAASEVQAQYQVDGEASIISDPADQDTRPEKTSFRLAAFFQNVGSEDLYDVPVRFDIVRCSDGTLTFRADTTIAEFYANSPAIEVTFPLKQHVFDLRKLTPGCYTAAAIIRLPNDGDRTNDTAYSTFTIEANTLPDDLATESILFPQSTSNLPPNQPFTIKARFINAGSNTEDPFTVEAIVFDKNGNIAYSSTITDNYLIPKEERDIAFTDFSSKSIGTYKLAVISKLSSDTYPFNDTIVSSFTIGDPCEAAMTLMVAPSDDETFTPGQTFIPEGLLRWEGQISPTPDIPVELLIQRCEDQSIVVQTGLIVSHNNIGPLELDVTFNSVILQQKLGSLSDGCYKVSIISSLACDTDPLNDTVFSVINIHYLHDIRIDSILSPSNTRYLINHPMQIRCSIANKGFNKESHVPVYSSIIDPLGSVVFRDTIFLNNWQSEQIMDTSFKIFTPTENGNYQLCVISLLDSDQVRSNDSLVGSFRVTSPSDVAALAVISPVQNAIIPMGELFHPIGLFQAYFGLHDFSDIPVSCQIVRCTDHVLMFQSDSTIAKLQLDSPATIFTFPTQQGSYDIRNLPIGCYEIRLIASYSSDADRSDDTAFIPFSVFAHSAVNIENEGRTDDFSLSQNYPNPFATSTTISYSIPENGKATLSIYDITGRIIRTESEYTNAGEHHVTLDLQNLSNGIYIYELNYTSENGLIEHLQRRMTLMK